MGRISAALGVVFDDELEWGQPTLIESLSEGCIAEVRRLRWADGRRAILKSGHAAADQFAAEASGLKIMAEHTTLRVPQVYAHSSAYLLMEDLDPQPPVDDYWQRCGQGLALLHSHHGSQYGFFCATYCGSTRQENDWQADGHRFFAEHRLLDLGQRCHQRGSLDAATMHCLQRLADRLPNIVPPQPASLLHGDLWSGNLISDSHGQGALIDPACWYGWAEAELAMTTLFGGFPSAFYRAYEEASTMERSWSQRADIYNLYHLLNHLLLFGGSYAAAVRRIAQRYGAP